MTLATTHHSEMCESRLGFLLSSLSSLPKLRRICLMIALKLEGGPFWSATARRIMACRYGVEVGDYSYGTCFVPGVFPPGVMIGRYVSIAPGTLVLRRNHPTDRLSTHPFFFNSRLGFLAQDNVAFRQFSVQHDAWIGERVVITPSCCRIGVGAVVGAGAVVTKDIPDFAIVGGNPARLIRMRFPDRLCDEVLRSKWWELPISECVRFLDSMTKPLEVAVSTHPLIRLRRQE